MLQKYNKKKDKNITTEIKKNKVSILFINLVKMELIT